MDQCEDLVVIVHQEGLVDHMWRGGKLSYEFARKVDGMFVPSRKPKPLANGVMVPVYRRVIYRSGWEQMCT